MRDERGHEWGRREEARLAFREAGREVRWAKDRYGQAQQAFGEGNGSPAELARTRQAWIWALAEWVRTLTIREEVLDGGRPAADSGMDVLSGSGGHSALSLDDAHRRVEALSKEYDRIRRSRSLPAQVDSARRAWSEALKGWARVLIAQEESRDRARIAGRENRDLIGLPVTGEDGPSHGRTGRRTG
ncbi:hypothetical protein [Streptosporangium sp. NBC_01756]|uniref:hypothetical protein n=1 Tax=Streptosporangium sp. NBC_01756 TaxID=2975950 RepID=UPI002DDC1977|nr:hypothetical protein [Streptosporangium sp. NBC_01756]WSC89161.1 hypothetical protein OIE48_13525 [Streptosporangium sp. NBC_01756]